MVFNKLLSLGDGTASGDYLDLTDASKYIDLGGDWGAPEDEFGNTFAERLVTRGIRIVGSTMDAAETNLAAIQTKLNQARLASSAMAGTTVTLGWQTNTTYPVYFDVLRGRTTSVVRSSQANYIDAMLELYTLPYARGTAVTLGITGTITNTAGTVGTPGVAANSQGGVYVADVPGDAPALCQVLLTDVSSSSQIINRVRMAVANRDSMASTDWLGWLDGTANSPGTAGTSQTNRVGANYGTVVTSDAWQDVIDVTFGTANKQRGEVDLWVRAQTSADIRPPENLVITGAANGNLQNNVLFSVRVTGTSGSTESAASDLVVAATTDVIDELVLTWTPLGTVTGHRVYFMGGTSSQWKYLNTGSAAGTRHITTTSGVTIAGTANPPTSSGIEGPYVRGQIGLSSMTTLQTGPGLQMMNGGASGTSWAMNYIGRHTVPPWPVNEGGTAIGTKGMVQAISGYPGYAPWIRLDCVVAMPAWPQIVAEYNGLALATAREWMIDTDRFGRSGALLRSTSDQTEQGQADVTGELYLLPGDNTIVVNVDTTGGASDVIDAKYRATVRYVPRYRGPGRGTAV